MNPYLVLNVPRDAEDRAIRKAYLDAIKNATPESDPKRFQMLTEAYERIKDESQRHEYLLFHRVAAGQSPLDALLRTAAILPPPKPLSFETLKEHCRTCAKS